MSSLTEKDELWMLKSVVVIVDTMLKRSNEPFDTLKEQPGFNLKSLEMVADILNINLPKPTTLQTAWEIMLESMLGTPIRGMYVSEETHESGGTNKRRVRDVFSTPLILENHRKFQAAMNDLKNRLNELETRRLEQPRLRSREPEKKVDELAPVPRKRTAPVETTIPAPVPGFSEEFLREAIGAIAAAGKKQIVDMNPEPFEEKELTASPFILQEVTNFLGDLDFATVKAIVEFNNDPNFQQKVSQELSRNRQEMNELTRKLQLLNSLQNIPTHVRQLGQFLQMMLQQRVKYESVITQIMNSPQLLQTIQTWSNSPVNQCLFWIFFMFMAKLDQSNIQFELLNPNLSPQQIFELQTNLQSKENEIQRYAASFLQSRCAPILPQ